MRAQILSCLLVPFFAASLFAQNASRDTFGESLMRYGQPHEEVKKTLPNDGDIIKIKTDLVSSDVLAVSPKGNPLIGLKKDDFVVSENGVPQEISVFSPAQDPKIGRSIILVFGYGVMIEPYIHSSVEAAKVLIDKLGPHDKMAIVNDQIELLSGFTTDKTALTNSLTAFEQIFWKRKNDHIEGARNGKPYISCGQHVDDQYSSLLAALNELVTKDDVRPVVIFQTNGDELPYLKPESKEWKELDKKYAFFRKQCPDSKEWDERPFSIDDIKDAVALSGAIVYSVIPGPRVLGLSEKEIKLRIDRYVDDFNRPYERKDWGTSQRSMEMLTRWNLQWQGSMAELAAFSGGYTEFLEDPKNAGLVYDNILTVMNNRYVVGYYSKDETRNGKRRSIKIEIKGHPEYGTMSRKAYLPRQQ